MDRLNHSRSTGPGRAVPAAADIRASPILAAALADPIVKALMASDTVTEADVAAALGRAASGSRRVWTGAD